MMIFDFRCKSCCGVFEVLANSQDRTAECVCGGTAHRIVSGTRLDYRMGVDPTLTTSADKWVRIRKQRQAAEKRALQEHGSYSRSEGMGVLSSF